MREFFCLLTVLGICFQLNAQCDPFIIDQVDTLCLDETIVFSNSSNPALQFEWDFCPNSIVNDFGTPVLTNITDSFRPFALDHIVVNDISYAFLVGWSNNLIRIKFPNGLKGIPEITDLGNPGGMFSTPQGIHIVEESGTWYALVTNLAGEVQLVDFGNDIENNTPSASLSTDLSSVGNLRGLTIEKEGSTVYALLAAGGSSGKLLILDYGSSLTNSPVTASNGINLPSFPTGISLIRDCDNWFGVVTSSSNSRVTKLNFGSSLRNLPSSQVLIGIFSPTGTAIVKDYGEFYAFTNSASTGNLYRIDFGTNFTDNDFSINDLGDLGVNNWAAAFQIIKKGSVYYNLAVGFDDHMLKVVEFDENCGVSIDFSDETEPTGISFSSQGWNKFEIRSIDPNQSVSTLNDSVYVRKRPVTGFSVQNTCENDIAGFLDQTVLDGTNAVSWNWNFDDPSSGSSNISTLQNPDHRFTAAGDYNILLEVTDDCGVSKDTVISIKIIPENDLQPDFAIPVGGCTNSPIQFIDSSTSTDDNIAGWFWDFGDPGSGQDNTSDLQNPTHEYSAGGSYDVTLTVTGQSGCQQTIMNPGGSPMLVIEGPAAGFSFQNSCAQRSVQFIDLSTGANINSWYWDFGNGTTSTLQNPEAFYNEAGDFDVNLTVTNLQGCMTTTQQTITIYGIPQVAFSSDLACNAEMTQFFDLTVIPNANPVQWDWDFGDGFVSTDQNPLHQFTGSGSYTVKLTVTSNFGCMDSLEQVVTVYTSPLANFSFNTVCSGKTVYFEDLSTAGPGENLVDWLWQIDGQIITEQNPSVNFTSSGDYLVELTVSSENLCTNTLMRTITINESPFIGFNEINACSNDFTKFENLSVPGSGDEIITYFWDFGGLGSSTVRSPSFLFDDPGTYPVTLTLTTERNCEQTLTKMVTIGQDPEAIFTPSVVLGAPPLEVSFSNGSANADSFAWDFGTGDSSEESEPVYTFNSIGNFDVRLVAVSSQCNDTIIHAIRVVEADLDVALDGLEIIENGQNIQLQLNLSNRGSVVITDMNIILDLGGKALVSEFFEGSMRVGEELIYTMKASPILSDGINYLCVRLEPHSGILEESDPGNNRDCVNQSDLFLQLAPYPNPASRLITLGHIVPAAGSIEISILDLTGKEVLNQTLTVLSPGLNSQLMDISTLDKGVYLLRSNYLSVTRTWKIILN